MQNECSVQVSIKVVGVAGRLTQQLPRHVATFL